jgi:hypothetical protein
VLTVWWTAVEVERVAAVLVTCAADAAGAASVEELRAGATDTGGIVADLLGLVAAGRGAARCDR